MSEDGNKSLGQLLAERDYLRQRLAPSLRDPDYLTLTDLKNLIEDFAQSAQGRVFDYGCGGAPYRSLFAKAASYVRADVTPGPEIDLVLQADGGTGEPANSCDIVLSTQVLEHVVTPEVYVRECLRILKPGGRLFLSTHGMFQEHGCPYDFYRWTAVGLEKLVAGTGFQIQASYKITTEVRGAIQLMNYSFEHFRSPERKFWHYLFGVCRKLYRLGGLPLGNCVGRAFAGQGVVPGSAPATIYTGVAVVGRKP